MGVFLIGVLLYTCSSIIVVDIVKDETGRKEVLYDEKSVYDEWMANSKI